MPVKETLRNEINSLTINPTRREKPGNKMFLCNGSFHVKSITQNITQLQFLMKFSTVVGSCENINIINKNKSRSSVIEDIGH